MLRRNIKVFALVFCFVMLLGMLSLADEFKVKLNLYERMVIAMSLLPKEGNFLTLKIIRELQMELAPSEEEAKIAGMEDVIGGGVKADDWFLVVEKEIVFGDIAKGIVIEALKELDKTEKLTNDHFTLYEKFIIIPEKVGENK